MLIALVIILLLIGAAVVGSIYSNFMVFYSNFAESENYHRAYYNSIAALERAELVIKQREPGYIGSGGWILGVNTGSYNGGGSDRIIESNFSYISDSSIRNNTSVFWDINSRTTRIPKEGKGDVDSMISANDSDDFNMMDYKDSQVFLLYYDNSGQNPYTKIKCNSSNEPCTQSHTQKIVGTIRLPGKLKDDFGLLDDTETLIVGGAKNDAIVDRQIRGTYSNNNSYPFNIYSTQNYYSGEVRPLLDSAIRENDINSELNFEFGQNKRSPIPNNSRGRDAILTIISPQENNIKIDLGYIKSTEQYSDHFNKVLENEKYTEKQLRLSLLNILKTTNNMIYPFLEYYVDFGTDISDKYFTINAEGNYNDYKINRLIWKPTNKESVLGSFTTIF